jgi:hypothetical protein
MGGGSVLNESRVNHLSLKLSRESLNSKALHRIEQDLKAQATLCTDLLSQLTTLEKKFEVQTLRLDEVESYVQITEKHAQTIIKERESVFSTLKESKRLNASISQIL